MPIWLKTLRTSLACLLALATWPVQAEKLSVVYAREIPETDSRLEYPVRLLELALKKSGTNYDIRAYPRPMPQGAALGRLATGAGINLAWSMTSKDREAQLLPIRIPIDKGLFGYRIAFVREQNKGIISSVKGLADLRAFSAGQGHDWPDTDILQGNGLRVTTSTAYEGLFAMLQAGRFDYFPRSILEIWDETGLASKQQLVVEDKVLLHYPAAIYFFVNKKDTALAKAIETGLHKAMADGSFDTLFYQRFGDVIKRANLRGRVAIALTNPLLPAATPLSRKALWLDVNKLPN
ncbi:hypothetical protein [Rhodoferax sp.]|uniref:hypothetical protein n=1 Tax=Rhodoferax sp. TaxID=50421 RepID=UPI002ACE039E|nr:hypothetical protein [Rhodoferax sp.]MDZ7919617.1 hypothetical protein [Rhodoferax sp.]